MGTGFGEAQRLSAAAGFGGLQPPDGVWPIWAGYVLLAVSAAICLRHALFLLPELSRGRWRLPDVYPFVRTGAGGRWERLWRPGKPETLEEYDQLLLRAGVPFRAKTYFPLKRALSGAAVLLLLSAWFPYGAGRTGLAWLAASLPAAFVLIAAWRDKGWLAAWGNWRSVRITEEIYHICHQLLYYAGSRMSLHARLRRCLPFTARLRKEWLLLLNEWYEDAEEALHRFKARVGTDEAHLFAETLNSLRQHESEQYYDLLRQRIRDYKDHMEMAREGRNESFSYILFVLAGIPVLNTFRIFIYPWVREGQMLFETLQ